MVQTKCKYIPIIRGPLRLVQTKTPTMQTHESRGYNKMVVIERSITAIGYLYSLLFGYHQNYDAESAIKANAN